MNLKQQNRMEELNGYKNIEEKKVSGYEYVGVGEKTDIQKRKALKQELREKVKKGDISREEMKRQLNRNNTKIINILAISEDIPTFRDTELKGLKGKLNNIISEEKYNITDVHIHIIRTLEDFRNKLNNINDSTTTFYILKKDFTRKSMEEFYEYKANKIDNYKKALNLIKSKYNSPYNINKAKGNTILYVDDNAQFEEINKFYGNEIKVINGFNINIILKFILEKLKEFRV